MTRRWQNLVEAIRKLPGIGPKMAERMALFLLRSTETESIVRTILEAKHHLKRCPLCGIFTEQNLCERCSDGTRDQHLLCIVEEISDLMALEKAGVFNGHYHLLGGALAPLDGIGPRDLRIEPLLNRLHQKDPSIDEIILATNPTVEGEATATYLSQLIHPLGKKISRLAYGLPSGSSLEYADELTLTRAFEGRRLLSEVR
ncbi:recombination protein RecR [bacterium F11]|nr:recombination protein RecR [bacterium F11]